MKPDNLACAAMASVAGGQVHAGRDGLRQKALTVSLEASKQGGTVVIHCQSPAMLHREARSLTTMITEILPMARRMVIDLAGVQSLHSEALGELVLTHMWAEAAGYALKFGCPSEAVRRLLDNTNLVSVLDVYPSVEGAVAALKQEEVATA